MAKRNQNSNSRRGSKTSKPEAAPEVQNAPETEQETNEMTNQVQETAGAETPAAVVTAGPNGGQLLVKVGTANKNRATMFGIPGRRGSIYVPNTLLPGFDSKAAESFVAPESIELFGTPFVAADTSKAEKAAKSSERKAKSAETVKAKADKLAERIAKAQERQKKDADRLAKLQAKLGVPAAAPEGSDVEQPEQETVSA